mgnify:CR=1 FL=1
MRELLKTVQRIFFIQNTTLKMPTDFKYLGEEIDTLEEKVDSKVKELDDKVKALLEKVEKLQEDMKKIMNVVETLRRNTIK